MDEATNDVYDELLFEGEYQSMENVDSDLAFCDMPLPESEPPAEEPVVDEQPAKTPRERLDRLFDGMRAYRKEFLAIIEYCRQPQPIENVQNHVGEMQRYEPSAYSATNLLVLLEDAGGLAKIDQNGEPFDEANVKPKEVVIDGVSYYEVDQEPPELFWASTEDALGILDEEDPVARVNALFEERADHMYCFEEVLRMAARKEGATFEDFDNALNPGLREAKSPYRASSFSSKLEEVGAIVWRGSWVITEFGSSLLDSIAQGDAVDVQAALAL